MADGLTPAQLDALDKKHAAPSAPPPVAAAPTPAPPKAGGLTPEELDRMAAPTPKAGSAPSHSFQMPNFGNPFAALKPIAQGAQRAAGSGIGTVFDILNRPHEAASARITAGPKEGSQAFIHGQSPESQDQTRAELRQKFGIADFYNSLSSKTWTSPNGNKIPGHVLQGLIDFAIDTGTDPLTYLGGFGIAEKGLAALGRAGTVGAARGIEAVGRVHPQAGAGLGAAFDFANYKGKTLRSLAASRGEEGIDKFQGLKSINNARAQRGADLGNTFTHHFDLILKDMKPEERDAMFQAIHTGTVDQLPEPLRMKAAAFKRMTDSLAHLSGTRGMRGQLAAEEFGLPEEFNRFDTQVRSLQRPAQYRQNYVPTAHELDTPLGFGSTPGSLAEMDQRIAGMAKQEAGSKTNPFRTILEAEQAPAESATHSTELHAEDPNLRQRAANAEMLPAKEQEQVIKARLRSGAKAIAARDAEREVARLFGVGGFSKVPPEAKQFFQETWTEPGGKEFWGGLARGLIDIPKVALFALPFRHMANIGTLSIFADPSIANITGTAGKFAQMLLTKDPAARAKILGLAHKYGVTGVPSVDRTAAGWIGRIPKIGEIYKASNHALWTFDDAAKATRFQRLVTKYQRTGLKESDAAYKAAADVGAEMIDYSNRSPLTQALAYIAPFATYRSKLPGAVARSVTRHPERVLAAGRASPAMVGDVQQSPGDPKGSKSFLPFADTLRAVDNPAAYVRATAGYPLQMAAGLAEKAIGRAEGSDTLPYSTYHKEPDLKYLANETLGAFPGASYLLDKAGFGEFQGQGSLQNVVGSQTGFNPARVPTLKEMKTQQHIDLERAKIEAARHGGNKALADQLETRLRGYLHYNHTYEK